MARARRKKEGPTAGRILFIDDEPDIVEPLMALARGLGFEARLLENGSAFDATLAAYAPTHVVVDLVMPEVDGIEVLLALSRLETPPRIMVMTGYHWGVMESARILAESHRLADIAWLQKPVDLDRFEALLAAPKEP
ncbi:MAG: response regulator [Alphaproteobacteria bacterium]|nr:response regulator [Alphaproteobacteria bacterium]